MDSTSHGVEGLHHLLATTKQQAGTSKQPTGKRRTWRRKAYLSPIEHKIKVLVNPEDSTEWGWEAKLDDHGSLGDIGLSLFDSFVRK